MECTIDKKHIIEYEGYNEIGTRLSNLPNLIQMLAAKTVPAGSYNMAEELKKDYTAIMESVKKPVCNNESEKELTIFSALPYIDGLDKDFVLKELPYFIEFGNSYTFYFLTRLIKTNNLYHLNYRSKDPYKVWGPHFFDISGIEVLKGDNALDSIDKILKNNKTAAPDFIWRSWGKEFVIVYKDDSGCKFIYEIKKCSLCEAPLMDEIWKSLGKEIQGLLKSETGSGKIKTYNSDPD